MTIRKRTISTIGYEGVTLDDFIATLKQAGVKRLVDVRALAISRRKGFAKTALSAALTAAEIDYIHLRHLGTPKAGRDAARANKVADFHRIFDQQLQSSAAQLELLELKSLADKGPLCLMCFERDPHTCHRTLVAAALERMLPITVRHLGA